MVTKILIFVSCIIFAISCAKPLDEIDLEPLLIEAGDLPTGYSGSQILSTLPSEFRGLPARCNQIHQVLAFHGDNIGSVSVLLFENKEDAETAYFFLSEEYYSLELRDDFRELVEEYSGCFWNSNVYKSAINAFETYFDGMPFLTADSEEAFSIVYRNIQAAVILSDIEEEYPDFGYYEDTRNRWQSFLNNLARENMHLSAATAELNPNIPEHQIIARDSIAYAGFDKSYIQLEQLERNFIELLIERNDNSRGRTGERDWAGPHEDLLDQARRAALEAAVDVTHECLEGYKNDIEWAIRTEGITQQQFTTYAALLAASCAGNAQLAQTLRNEIGEEQYHAAQCANSRFKGAAGGLSEREAGGVALAAPVCIGIATAVIEAGIEGHGEEVWQYLLEHRTLNGLRIEGMREGSVLYRASRGNIYTNRLVAELDINNIIEQNCIGETHQLDEHRFGDTAVSSIVEIPEEASGFQAIDLLWKSGHAVVHLRVLSYGSFDLNDMLSYGTRLNSRLAPHVCH